MPTLAPPHRTQRARPLENKELRTINLAECHTAQRLSHRNSFPIPKQPKFIVSQKMWKLARCKPLQNVAGLPILRAPKFDVATTR
jgi:hypothetical protein